MSAPDIPRFSRTERQECLVEALGEVGAIIVDDLVDRCHIDAIIREVGPFVDDADPEMAHINDVLQTFFNGVRNVTGLAGKSPTFVDAVMLDPVLLGTAETVLAPNAASISLNVGHLMVREPGAQQQWLHRDQNVWSFVPEPHPELEVSSVTALSDFTKDNGGTAVVPGSHRWEPGREPQPHEVTYAEMPAGAAVIYLGSTIHAGGTNVTSKPRAGLHVSYVVGWLRTEENNSLATPPNVARTLPRRAQELLGYDPHDASKVGGGYLGLVEMQNPADLLADGTL